MDSLTFKVVHFEEQETTVKLGINVQYLNQGKYVETEVPKSENKLEVLRLAMEAVSGDIEVWKSKVASPSAKTFHVEETEASYIVTYSEQFLGASIAIKTIVDKSNAQSHVDAVSQAWASVEPQVTPWKTNISLNNFVEGRYFRIQNGNPVLI